MKMDINSYIKIKKIPFINLDETAYIRGIVIKKNVALKKMITYFDNPKILIIKDSLDLTDNFEASLKSNDSHKIID